MNREMLAWALVAVALVALVALVLPRGRDASDAPPTAEAPVAVSSLTDLGNLAMGERASDPTALDRALENFRRGNALDPKHLNARFGLAWAGQLKGLPESEWRELYHQIVSEASLLAYVSLYNMAYADQQAERHPQAIASLEHALRLMPERADGWLELGAAHLAIGKHARAVEHLGRAAKLDAGSARTFRLLGQAHAALGQKAEAQVAFGRASRLNQGSASGSESGRGR